MKIISSRIKTFATNTEIKDMKVDFKESLLSDETEEYLDSYKNTSFLKSTKIHT